MSGIDVLKGAARGAARGSRGGLLGAAAGAVVGAVVVIAGPSVVESLTRANSDEGLAKTKADECVGDCEQEDPCKEYERGGGSGPYRGGSIRGIRPAGPGREAHHLLARQISPLTGGSLSTDRTPAIQMDRDDHTSTSNWGSGGAPDAIRAQQRILVEAGQGLQAVYEAGADVASIAAMNGQPGKYNRALREAYDYAECLARNGRL